jgi:hypothetical protein
MKDKIEEFLTKNKISGLFYIPGRGTFSMFDNDKDKLLLLEHARIELVAREKLIEKEANAMIAILSNESKTKSTQGYVG